MCCSGGWQCACPLVTQAAMASACPHKWWRRLACWWPPNSSLRYAESAFTGGPAGAGFPERGGAGFPPRSSVPKGGRASRHCWIAQMMYDRYI